MDIKEKRQLCLEILESLIHLRIVFLATYKIYQNCTEALAGSWENSLSDFVNEKFFDTTRKKYYEIYRNGGSTTALIPLKLKTLNRIALTASNNLIALYDQRRCAWRYIADAQILCGIDRKRNKKDIEVNYADNPSAIFELQDPTSEILKKKEGSGTFLESSDFFALLHLLHYGKTKLSPNTIPPVAEALYQAACELSVYAFRKYKNNKIEYPKFLNKTTKNWLKELTKKIQLSELEAAMGKVDPRLALFEGNSNINQLEALYCKIAKGISSTIAPPEEIAKCEYENKFIINAFNLAIDIDDAIISKNKNRSGYYKNDTCFNLGNSTKLLLEAYENKIISTFAEEILVAYMLLMATTEATSLLGVKTTIQEAKKEYLNYLNSLLVIRDAFGEQFLPTML